MSDAADEASGSTDLELAIRLIAVDPGIGLRLRGPADPVRDAILERLRALLPSGTPWRTMPATLAAARLLDGVDVAATLAAGARRASPSFLAAMAGGLLLLPGVERIEPRLAAALASALEVGGSAPAGLVLLDDARGAEEVVPTILADRAGMDLDLGQARVLLPAPHAREARAVLAARARLPRVRCPDALIEALCAAALSAGVSGLRVPLLALRAAKAAAALDGRSQVRTADADIAARLCLAPRATSSGAVAGEAQAEPPSSDNGASNPEGGLAGADGAHGSAASTAIAAARAGLPVGLIEAVAAPGSQSRNPGRAGGRGAAVAPRGRVVATRPGRPDDRHPIDLAATLRAALPWQAWRGRAPAGLLRIRPDDLRVAIRRAPPHVTTVVAVDASGSAALGRLAEAKGAVELLLARCYVRRDSVALVAFGGSGATLLLPPTRSLARAKRELAELPGGGGTPLASGLDLAAAAAAAAQRDGSAVRLAVLTDGRANLSRSGAGGRAAAEADSLDAAARIRAARLSAVVIDVAPRPGAAARRLAEAMGARYVALPRADAGGIADTLMPAPGAAF